MTNEEFKRRLHELCKEASTENFADAIKEVFSGDERVPFMACAWLLAAFKHHKPDT